MSASHESTGPIRVFLVDDHRIVRSGVAAYLAMVEDIEVVGKAGTGAGPWTGSRCWSRPGSCPTWCCWTW
ncbi:response regulator transcription factor [Streptacidiphilus sp. 4-A2]|nr:response regulator transcription factor [Streptacidiphilus sp. 4-A2]